jgi:hypothetical protein
MTTICFAFQLFIFCELQNEDNSSYVFSILWTTYLFLKLLLPSESGTTGHKGK